MTDSTKPKSPSQAIPKRRTTQGGQSSRVRHGQPRSTKIRRTVVPPPQSARIVGRYIAGASIREISREEKRDRATVTKIVRSDQVGDYICRVKERFYALGEDALNAVQHALREQKDGRLGFQLLASIGAVPSPMELERLQTAQATSDEEGAVREMGLRLLGCAMERARVYGHDLPELKEDLKKVGGRFNRKTGKIEPLGEEDCDQLS
jgi:hypothetical protein